MNKIICTLIELVLFMFEIIRGILRSIAPALIFAMFFILQDIEITEGVGFIIMFAIIGGLIHEMGIPKVIRGFISDKLDKTKNGN